MSPLMGDCILQEQVEAGTAIYLIEEDEEEEEGLDGESDILGRPGGAESGDDRGGLQQ